MLVLLCTQTCRYSGIRIGKTRALLDRILRVDHAGEYGAVRIYQGQLAVLGRQPVTPVIKDMLQQEKHHLATFEQLLPQQRVRPTVLMPLWHVAGFALGAGSALLGKQAAMACTVAVETVIGGHYDQQIRALLEDGRDGASKHKDLIQTLQQFRDEELEHLDTGLEYDAEMAPFYDMLSNTIKVGCKTAVWLSERI